MPYQLIHKKLSHISIISIICFTLISCSHQSVYDQTKAHHTEDGFKSSNKKSTFDWLSMRFKEGSFPSVKKSEADSIVTKVNEKLIHSFADTPRATWLGHATVLVQYKGINFLTDPHLTDYAAPLDFLGDKRLTPPALNHEQLPAIDFVVISHNHYDHLDLKTVILLGNSVTWYVPLGLKSWFEDQGIHSNKVIELDWWDSHQFNEKVLVTFTPTKHWSKRSLFDNNKSLWGSWPVKIEQFNSWFAGDTGYDDQIFKQIGRKTGPYDLSFIPIGAYAPIYFMQEQHVNPSQAVQIHEDIKSKQSMPIHWGTFQLTKEPFLEPPQLLKDALKDKNIPQSAFRASKIGETIGIKLRSNK